MPRKRNDGRGRLGGRAKGTPNKATSTLKEFVTELINSNREQLLTDIAGMEPKDRVNVLLKLIAYVMPKPTDEQEAVTIARQGSSENDIVLFFGGKKFTEEPQPTLDNVRLLFPDEE